MPDDPRLTIRAGRRSSGVAGLLPGELEDRDEVATPLVGPAEPDLPVVRCHREGSAASIAPPIAAGLRGRGGGPIPVAPLVSRVDGAFDEPGTLRRPKLAARVRPSIGELNWKARALASPCVRSVESGSP
jgi:hypothetical protein